MTKDELLETLKLYTSLNFIEKPKFMLSVGFEIIGDTIINSDLLIKELQIKLREKDDCFIEIYGIDEYKKNGGCIVHINCGSSEPKIIYGLIENLIISTSFIRNIYVNFRYKGEKYYSTESKRIKYIEENYSWPEIPSPNFNEDQIAENKKKQYKNFFKKIVSLFK